jgi:hypothetical protein
MWLKVVLIVIIYCTQCLSSPDGAHPAACENLMPVHGDNQPQISFVPVNFILSTRTVQQGNTMTLTLESQREDFYFRGFMVQARLIADTSPGDIDMRIMLLSFVDLIVGFSI